MVNERLKKQLDFILEVDKTKNIFRRSLIHDGSRRENDAEHSWHIALMAFLFSEYSKDSDVDILKVMKMCLIHDIIEIDAGDTFCYDELGRLDKLEREQKAADRIFGLLPDDQGKELRELWEEFDATETPEAKYAAAFDRLEPILLNYANKGGTWQEYNIKKSQVLERINHISDSAPELYEFAVSLLDKAIEQGYLPE